MSMKLVIAEKPSVSAELAKVLGSNKRENGFYSGNEYLISWCVGHLIETVMPESYDEAYAKWNIKALPIVPKEWKYKVSAGVQTQFNVVESLMNREDVEEIICATDAGREGELIFRLVYNQVGCQKPFKRLWISSMETKAIKIGFEKLKSGKEYDNLYAAALSRLQADWLVGINFSRLFSLIANKPLNVGRVQTPTVNLIVERQRAIDNFDSKPFYIITAKCISDGITFSANKRVDDKVLSQSILEKCNGKPAKVTSMTKTPQNENPPALYDLTTLQREANKILGLSAQQTLDATQSLYEKKLVTYPRTDSRYLTSDMKGSVKVILESLCHAPYLYENTVRLFTDENTKKSYFDVNINIDRLINDKKVTDHHAIIPTIESHKLKINLPRNELNVLILITYKILMAAYLPHKYIKTELALDIESEEFKATGRQITQEGFKELNEHLFALLKSVKAAESSEDGNKKTKSKKQNKKDLEEKEEVIPPLLEGQVLENSQLSSKEKTTQPPKPYTEDTLLSAMENAMKTLEDEDLKKDVSGVGLGTPATRAGIIERIIKTEFIERKAKNLLPMEKAYEVVDVVPEKVKSSILTAEWEQKLEQIYKGEISERDFISDIEKLVEGLVENYKGNYAENGKEIIGTCPRCSKNIFEGKTNYYCEGGRECNFVIWKEDKFFISKRKPLTKPMVQAFLKKGRIKAINLYSEKKDTTYSAYIIMEDTGQYVNFRLIFPK